MGTNTSPQTPRSDLTPPTNPPPPELLKAAWEYQSLGFSVLPIGSRNEHKAPIAGITWRHYQEELKRPSPEKVDEWFRNSQTLGIGIMTGKVSGGLEVLDIDTKNDPTGTILPDIWSFLEEYAGGAGLLIVETRSRGLHIYYRTADPLPSGHLSENEQGKPTVEIRGAAGYILAPPSQGYTILQGSYDSIPTITEELRESLLAKARSYDCNPKNVEKVSGPALEVRDTSKRREVLGVFSDYNLNGDVFALLTQYGFKIGETDADKTFIRRPGDSDRDSGNFHHGFRRLHLFSTEAGILKAGNYSPFDLFMHLECGGDEERAKKELKRLGFGRQESRTENGTPAAPKTSGFSFSFATLDELFREPEEETSFIWDRTFPAGGFSLLTAKPKVGKSTLMRNLAVAVSRGEPFLGRSTVKGKVLYLCLEEKRQEVRKHFERMGAGGESILIHSGDTPRSTVEAVEALRVAIEAHSPSVVFVDPLSRVARKVDFNDYGLSETLELFIDLARESGAHICALHHEGKGEREGSDSILGSTALFGAVDCHLSMKRRQAGRTVTSSQRYGEDLPETVLDLQKDTGLVSEAGELSEVLQARTKADVLSAVGPDRVMKKTVQERLQSKWNGGQVSAALRVLVMEGRLIQSGNGKKGDPFMYETAQATVTDA